MPSGLALAPSLVKAVTFFRSIVNILSSSYFSFIIHPVPFSFLPTQLFCSKLFTTYCSLGDGKSGKHKLFIDFFQSIKFSYKTFSEGGRTYKSTTRSLSPTTSQRGHNITSYIICRSISTRTIAVMWWFFTLIMMSSYTANLAG